MEFRVTVSLGQSSVDPAVLDERAAALHRELPADSQVVVDVVKAVVQVVLTLDVADAVAAAESGLQITDGALRTAAIERPASIVQIEAEAVATPITGDNVLPHPAP